MLPLYLTTLGDGHNFIVKKNPVWSQELLREQEERKQARPWRRDLLVIQGGRRNDVLFRVEQGRCKDFSVNSSLFASI